MNLETITILIGFLALVGGQFATFLTLIVRMDRQSKQIENQVDALSKEMNRRFDDVNKEMNRRFDDVNNEMNKRFHDVDKRFDETIREIADQRERMARLEGSLEGFLAGRRDRDAA